jgi:hypothetical protein
VDEREQIATHATEMWPRHRDRSVRCDRRVDGVAATFEDHIAGTRRDLIGCGDQVPGAADTALG